MLRPTTPKIMNYTMVIIKKVIGKFKDEQAGKKICEFVGLSYMIIMYVGTK